MHHVTVPFGISLPHFFYVLASSYDAYPLGTMIIVQNHNRIITIWYQKILFKRWSLAALPKCSRRMDHWSTPEPQTSPWNIGRCRPIHGASGAYPYITIWSQYDHCISLLYFTILLLSCSLNFANWLFHWHFGWAGSLAHDGTPMMESSELGKSSTHDGFPLDRRVNEASALVALNSYQWDYDSCTPATKLMYHLNDVCLRQW